MVRELIGEWCSVVRDMRELFSGSRIADQTTVSIFLPTAQEEWPEIIFNVKGNRVTLCSL